MTDKLNQIADTIRDITKLELDSAEGHFDAVIIITETNGHKYRAAVRTTLSDEKLELILSRVMQLRIEVD